MLSLLFQVIAIVFASLVVLGILVALAFFVGVVSYGWLSTIAPEEELAALPPMRRRLVTVRALVVLAVFWAVLLAVNSVETRSSKSDTGDKAFAYWMGTLRRLSGLPAQPAAP
jgi:hypothetical protein